MNSEIDFTKSVRLYKTETKFWQKVINRKFPLYFYFKIIADTLQADVRSGKLDEKGQEDLGSDISLKKNNSSLCKNDPSLDLNIISRSKRLFFKTYSV